MVVDWLVVLVLQEGIPPTPAPPLSIPKPNYPTCSRCCRGMNLGLTRRISSCRSSSLRPSSRSLARHAPSQAAHSAATGSVSSFEGTAAARAAGRPITKSLGLAAAEEEGRVERALWGGG